MGNPEDRFCRDKAHTMSDLKSPHDLISAHEVLYSSKLDHNGLLISSESSDQV